MDFHCDLIHRKAYMDLGGRGIPLKKMWIPFFSKVKHFLNIFLPKKLCSKPGLNRTKIRKKRPKF